MLMRKIALQQLRQRHRPPVDQKLKQVTKLGHAGASIKKSRTWSQTSRRPGLRQDRSNGIWT